MSPFAFGIYLDTITQAKKFRSQFKRSNSHNSQHQSANNQSENQDSDSDASKNKYIATKCVNILTTDTCPACSETLCAEDIITGWKKSYNEYTTRCQTCSKDFVAS